MRIVVYPHLLSMGGSQLNAIELAAAVRDRGHSVTVFAAEDGPLAGTVRALDLPLEIAPPHKRRPSPIIAAALRDICRRDQVDIVHGYEWPPALEAWYGPLLLGGTTAGCTVMSMAVAPLIPSSLPIVVGTEQIAAAARRNRAGSVRVIEPPVDTATNHAGIDGGQFRHHYSLGDYPLVVIVSRLAQALKLEGLERAIAAAQSLAAETRFRLVLVGDGPAREQLSRQAAAVNAATGERTVILTGELADPRPAYAAADLVLGMGGSALRAMAFAKPVVVLGELGFASLLTPESAPSFLWQGFYGLGDGTTAPSTLAAIIRPLLMDAQLRKSLGQYSRELIETRFSLSQAAIRQEEIYGAWLANPLRRSTVLLETMSTSAKLMKYKVRRRVLLSLGREAGEDFNSVSEIAKTASAAGTNSRAQQIPGR